MFKPLYYLGCKASFSRPIVEAISEVATGSGQVCDLFAGTGAIGATLAPYRDVTTVDVQEYSRVICSAQLRPTNLSAADASAWTNAVRSSEIHGAMSWCFDPIVDFEKQAIASALAGSFGDLVALLEAAPMAIPDGGDSPFNLSEARKKVRRRLKSSGLLGSSDCTVSSYFGGIYFSYQQSVFLDAALVQASAAPEDLRDTLVAAALSSASSIVNTVGKQFAQPLRPREKSGSVKRGLGSVVHRDRIVDASLAYEEWLIAYSELQRSGRNHRCLRMDYLDALDRHGSEFSVVYADPPYTRDHYSRFYHVLETMCLRDSPQISLVKKNGATVPSRGLYRQGRHQSPFCIRSEAPKALADLFEAACRHDVPVVLSYSPHESGDGTHPRVLSASDIMTIARQYYRSVSTDLLDGSTHNKLNRSDLGLAQREHAEMVVTCHGARRR